MPQTITVLSLLVGVLCVYWAATGKRLNIGIYLLAVYIGSIAGSFYIEPFADHKYSYQASFYFLFVLLMFLIPILKFKSTQVRAIAPANPHLFNAIACAFIVLGLASHLTYLPKVIDLFSSGESFAAMRSDVVGGETNYEINGVFYLFALFSQFYPIVLVFYFYSLTHTNNGWLFNALLLLSSTTYIVSILLAVGRDGVVLWAMSYVFTYILFARMMTSKQRMYQRRLAYCLGAAFGCIFWSITSSRHLVGKDYSALAKTTVSYFSMQFGNFNNFYNTITAPQDDVATILPVVRFLGHSPAATWQQKHDVYFLLYNIDVNVFATFIGDLFMSMDTRILAIVAVLYCGFLCLVVKSRKIVSLGQIIGITLIAQMPLHGIFYNKLMYTVSNIYMVVGIFLAVLFGRSVASSAAMKKHTKGKQLDV